VQPFQARIAWSKDQSGQMAETQFSAFTSEINKKVVNMLENKNRRTCAVNRTGALAAVLSAALLGACGGGGGDGAGKSAVSAAAPSQAPDDAVLQSQNDKIIADLKREDDDPADAADKNKACKNRNNNTFKKLLGCVTLDGVRQHQLALQNIANANGGTRVAGTKGFDDSADYAEKVFRDAGYNVTRQSFQFQSFIELPGTTLAQVAPPPPATLPPVILSYSGSGNVTAPVSALATPTGCAAADFAGFPAGNVALIARGSCSFAIKATNAKNAGASAVVIYNNTTGPLNGTLGEGFALDIAVVSVEQTVGQQLAATAGLVLTVTTSTVRGLATTSNVIAETVEGDPDNVVMVGAHLDSVDAGPGIQDNGSGSAVILEVAVQMSKVKPRNKVRFALWSAEESGLVGSTNYVDTLPTAEKDKIALYLNFDMIGSPNHVFFIYDGDNSDGIGSGPGPVGSTGIEKTFETFYNRKGVPFKGTDFDGRSDYGPFIASGIPAGGLFTGAEGVKTAAEAEVWGGIAGTAYDPCYHQACDNYGNINLFALDVNSDAVAYATLQFAMTTEAVNGIKGKRLNPRIEKSASDTAPDAVPTWQPYPKRFAN
jgi:Zn-dependent M28 family amino/carboxypeptidase